MKYEGLDYMVGYWLQGNVPLALLLDAAGLRPEHDLSALTQRYLDVIVRNSTISGRLGPDECGGPFAKMTVVRALPLSSARYLPANPVPRALPLSSVRRPARANVRDRQQL